ncbi:hypothetical protein ACLQ18_35975 [Streptomyces sp. DT193]|uniref:hypothetical protein n=1 Tax=Streptomyces sp. DT193 TaxID=3393418 RepID=UPI003CE6EF1A
MNSVPQHLLSEDRQEYERILDEALRSVPYRPELAAAGQRLSLEQLRTMALSATALITVAAAAEYARYVNVREDLRRPAFSSDSSHTTSPSVRPEPSPAVAPSALADSDSRPGEGEHSTQAGLSQRFGAAVLGQLGGRRFGNGVAAQRWARMSYGRRLLATLLGLHVRPQVPTNSGGGEAGTPSTSAQPMAVHTPAPTSSARRETLDLQAVPVLVVLAPVFAGTITAIFLLVGYVLRMLNPAPTLAQTMLTAGWASGAITAAAVLASAARIFLTVPRNKFSPEDGPYGELPEEVTRARDAWRAALLERGILPFLREALADPGAAGADRSAPALSRIPHLGYSRPDFSSPGSGSAAGPRRQFSSPDYSSPDYGGPEHQPK